MMAQNPSESKSVEIDHLRDRLLIIKVRLDF